MSHYWPIKAMFTLYSFHSVNTCPSLASTKHFHFVEYACDLFHDSNINMIILKMIFMFTLELNFQFKLYFFVSRGQQV